jgi:hypothetical protein
MTSDHPPRDRADQRPIPGRLAPDEPRFETLYLPERYPTSTDGPVVWAPVSKDGEVLGYIWAAEAGDGADYILRPGHPKDGLWLNSGVAWIKRLRRGWADRLAPVDALEQWASDAGLGAEGVVGRRRRAHSLAELLDLIAKDNT